MKKTLLLSAALLSGLAINAQTARKAPNVPPVLEEKIKNLSSDNNIMVSEKNLKPTVHNPNKVQAPPYKKISSSINGYTLLVSQSSALSYNKATNTVMFTHRKGPDWTITPAANNNSGAIQCTWTGNNGTAWDSTIVFAADSLTRGRYPSGAIYNPTGNTAPTGAKALVMGPITPGTGWSGSYFSSGPLTHQAVTTSGAIYVPFGTSYTTGGSNLSGPIGFPRIDLQEYNGTIWGTGGLYGGDLAGTTAAAQMYYGAALIKATTSDNGTTFVWKSDSIKPSFMVATDGSNEASSQTHLAFSPDGQTGYALFNGIAAGATGAKQAYQPIVYKTTNGGGTWTQVNAGYDWTKHTCIIKSIYPSKDSTGNESIRKPFFSDGYGSDVTVDNNGKLHYVCVISSGASNHVDSLGYTMGYDFATSYPYVWDLVTSGDGNWTEYFVDSLMSNRLLAATTENPWTDGTTGVAYDNRIQVSRTTDGSRIFVGWTDSDQGFTGNIYNVSPDIFVRGINASNMKISARKNMNHNTQEAHWMYMSNITMEPSAGNYQIPFTYSLSRSGNFNMLQTLDHHYVDDATIADADISGTITCPFKSFVGINENSAIEAVAQNFPNPFDNSTSIKVTLKSTEDIKLSVYNTMGQMVNYKVVKGISGENNIVLDAANLVSGVYFYSINVNGNVITKKMTVQKQ